MDSIIKYFPLLQPNQIKQFEALKDVYSFWNARINVISRKDFDNFYLHHVLHSLAIARYIQFLPGQKVLDVGTGGGFPGVPLAIMFPETKFCLIDGIAKKIKVVNEACQAINIKNVTAKQQRAEELKGQFHYVVSRAVALLPKFIPWVEKKISKDGKDNGILYLKGGDIGEELDGIRYENKIIGLSEFYEEEFFDTKLLVHVFMNRS